MNHDAEDDRVIRTMMDKTPKMNVMSAQLSASLVMLTLGILLIGTQPTRPSCSAALRPRHDTDCEHEKHDGCVAGFQAHYVHAAHLRHRGTDHGRQAGWNSFSPLVGQGSKAINWPVVERVT